MLVAVAFIKLYHVPSVRPHLVALVRMLGREIDRELLMVYINFLVYSAEVQFKVSCPS